MQSRDNFRATVRYVGRVDGATPEEGWIGIEWDAEGRGKHNGTAKGKQYFECADGYGSFVRAETMLVEPTSFKDAFVKKYASEDAASAEEKMKFRDAGRKKAAFYVELVGKDKEVKRMAKTTGLEEVTLPHALISHAGDTEWIKENATGITSLALDDNLFCDWEAVAQMTCQLPNLTTLTLNGNRLMPLLKTPSPDLFLNAFPCLKKLALNSTGANLEQIGLIKSYLVHLTDLHIASNKIASIGNGGANFFEGWPSLQLLDLSDNALSSWEEVLELAAFPRLQRLILSSNRLPSISFPADRPGILPELRLLAVANNKLADWASMEALSSLPALGELRVQGNAICETMGTTALRQMLVARLPALVLVNGGEVRARDRMEAEKFYVRYRLTHAEGKTAEELSLSDALFAKLVEKHGVGPVRAATTGGGGGSMLTVTLKSMAAESSHKKEVTRRLPGSMSVAAVKRMCKQLFGLEVAQQALFAKPKDEPDVWNAEAMTEDLKPIAHYVTWEEGDIVMQEINEEMAADEAADKAEAEAAEERKRAAMMAAQQEEVDAAKQAVLRAAAGAQET